MGLIVLSTHRPIFGAKILSAPTLAIDQSRYSFKLCVMTPYLPGTSTVTDRPVKKSKFQEQQRKIDDLDAEEALDSRCLIALQYFMVIVTLVKQFEYNGI